MGFKMRTVGKVGTVRGGSGGREAAGKFSDPGARGGGRRAWVRHRSLGLGARLAFPGPAAVRWSRPEEGPAEGRVRSL